MISLFGLVILGGAIAALRYMLPRNGVTVRAATMPVLESVPGVKAARVIATVFGIAMYAGFFWVVTRGFY
jgi:hypothetical protein